MKYIKYESFSEIHEHQEVKITTNDNWNEMFGVVERVVKSGYNNEYSMAVIFCTTNPDMRYLVFPYNLDTIEMVKY